mgnify:FL=1
MDIQLKRGILEVCVLAVLARGDSYGYQIIKDVSTCIEISESTLYPILRRLESGKLVSYYSVEHNGRLRKYYKITDLGRQRINEFLEEWKELLEVYNFITKMKDGAGNEQA